MPSRTARSASRKTRSLWLTPALIGATFALSAAGATVAYAAHLENRDSFCASCHTQPETKFYEQSLAAPVDLATSHAAQQVTCIQCHSGAGVTGRLAAMTTVALPDLLAYRSGKYHDPAVTTMPVSDDHCLKCHRGVESNRDFNNHFHAFLPLWQARAGRQAAGCVDCHSSHGPGGDPQMAYLSQSVAEAVCQRCHAFAGS
ncbi:MAG TPA: cytochrome c3 family protein [Anaerolineales bacterium]|nr:cytochrome c3 family protein [Anaerolineales bacterium]